MSATEEIRALLESHLEAIDREVLDLRDTLERLESSGAPARASRPEPVPASAAGGRTRSAQPRASRRKKRPAVVDVGELENLLGKSGDGLSAAALAEQVSGSPDEIRALLKRLEAAGRVRRTGQRRGTRWHVITEESWIAQRAAELEARSKRAAERKAA